MGRPKKVRKKVVGVKVRNAISFWGKSISKNNISENHVCNWSRWKQCGLPKSPTTVYDDIERGVPIDRVCNYAKCFNIKVDELLDDSMDADSSGFVSLISKARSEVQAAESDLTDEPHDSRFSEHFQQFNAENKVKKLYDLMSGCYIVNYAFLNGPEVIVTAACRIDSIKNNCLVGKAFYRFSGADMALLFSFYRWHNNLHVRYYSGDYFELGYLIGTDPLRHQTIWLRNPFCFRMLGITDDGSELNNPISNRVLFEKQGGIEDHVWENCLEYQRQNSVIEKDDDRYQSLRDRIMASDI